MMNRTTLGVLALMSSFAMLRCDDTETTLDNAGQSGGQAGQGGSGAASGSGGSSGAQSVQFCQSNKQMPYAPTKGAVTLWPDNYWTTDDDSSPTTKRLHIVAGENFILTDVFRPFSSVLEDLSRLDGFGTTSGMLVQFNTAVDVGSLPPSGDGSADKSSSILLIDLDATEPIFLDFESRLVQESEDDTSSTLIITPSLPLRPKSRYGLVITDRLKDIDGSCISPSDEMVSLLTESATDPSLSRLSPDIKLLTKKLVDSGAIKSISEITIASVFTTQHTIDDSAAIADDIRTTDITYESLGQCSVDSSGRYRVCEGKMHGFDYREAHHHIDEKNLTKHGEWVVPVTTYLPVEISQGPLPTFVFGHGLGGERQQAAELAYFTGPKNMAVIAIDAVKHGQHPDQPPSPDDPLSPLMSFFGLSFAGDQRMDTRQLRDNFRQSTYDKLQLVQMIRPGLDIDGDSIVDINTEQLFYLGVSLGGIMASEFLAFADDTKVAIPIVPGARVTDIIQSSPTFAPLVTLVRGQATDGDVARSFPLIQTAIDRGDPGAYLPHIVKERLPGFAKNTPQTLMQMVVNDDIVPNVCNTYFARGLGVPLLGDELVTIGSIDRQTQFPVSANLDSSHTGGVFIYDLVWDTSTDCCDLSTGTTKTATHSNVAANPITIEQTLRFVDSYLESSLPEVIDPYRELGVKP